MTERRAGICPWEPQAVAWLQGELPSREAEAFQHHIGTCPSCRAFVADTGRLLEALAAAPAGGTLRSGPRSWPWLAGLAALLLVALVLQRGRAPEHADSLDLLADRMGPEGTWEWDGLKAQEVSLHAFALLALAEGPSSLHGRDVRRAADWLVDRQAQDGSFGLPGSFDHPVAAVALLVAADVTGDQEHVRAARRAVDVLLSDAGQAGTTAPGNAGLPAWRLRALMLARERGWSDVEPAVDPARRLLLAHGGRGPAWDAGGLLPLTVGPPTGLADGLGEVAAASFRVLGPAASRIQ